MIEVKSTNDYDRFKFYKSNRPPNHWPKIANSIKKRDLTPYKPILVSSEFFIIDGQGRFMACKKLGKPIYYIVGSSLDEQDIILLNLGQENWSPMDFLNFYVDKGNHNYVRILQTLNECDNLKLGNIINSIYQSRDKDEFGRGVSSSEAFKSGTYLFPESAVKKTRLVSKILKVIEENVPDNEFKRTGSLVSALSSITVQEVDTNRLITQLKKYNFLFKAQGDHLHYKRHLEYIYNYRKREKKSFAYL